VTTACCVRRAFLRLVPRQVAVAHQPSGGAFSERVRDEPAPAARRRGRPALDDVSRPQPRVQRSRGCPPHRPRLRGRSAAAAAAAAGAAGGWESGRRDDRRAGCSQSQSAARPVWRVR